MKMYGCSAGREKVAVITTINNEVAVRRVSSVLNRPVRLTQGFRLNSNPLGRKRFVSGISISFNCECHIIMRIQFTKNVNPGRFELCTIQH